MYLERRRRIRVFEQSRSIVVLGTQDVPYACQQTGIVKDSWFDADVGMFAKRGGAWVPTDPDRVPKDAVPGVLFIGPLDPLPVREA